MSRFFFYDPYNGVEFFETEAERNAAAQQAIDTIRKEGNVDIMGWPEEELACLCMGVVTHTAQPTHIEPKPPAEQLKESGYDSQGRNWKYVDYICEYEMCPLPEEGAPHAS